MLAEALGVVVLSIIAVQAQIRAFDLGGSGLKTAQDELKDGQYEIITQSNLGVCDGSKSVLKVEKY